MTRNEEDEAFSTGREGAKVGGLLTALVVVGFVVAYQFVGPPPPKHIVLATGSPEGAYHAFGPQYVEELAKVGIEVELATSAGSLANVEALRTGAADVAFVQGGTVPPEAEEFARSIASVYFEPLWIFHRAGLEVSRLTDLAGARIQIGAEGSGTRAVASELLSTNGVDGSNATWLGLPNEEAAAALVAGELDALFVVAAPRSAVVTQLMEHEGGSLRLLDVGRHLAYERTHPYLAHAVLAEGVLDFERNVPDREIDLVSPTAALLAREDLHPALIPLFIRAAERIHGGGDLFAAPGTFPSPHNVDVPLSRAAREYFANGLSFLYRVLPFWLAATLDRLKIMLLPLLTLLLPLMRVAPPLYQWRIRRKIYRWYSVLKQVEQAHDRGNADTAKCLARLDEVEREVRETVRVPASYMEELHNLRMHVDRARERIEHESG